MTKINIVVRLAFAPVLVAAIAGCGGKSQQVSEDDKPGLKWTKPPAEAPAPPEREDIAIDPALQKRALRELLLQAGPSNTAILRAHAIEALKDVGGEEGQAIILDGLSDRHALVRFSSAMAAGENQLSQARPTLLTMLEDPSTPVQIAVRYALHRVGDYTHSHDLEIYVQSDDKRVRSNAVVVLGMLGEPSAKKILIPMLRDPDPLVRLQVAEALWRLHDETGLKALIALSLSVQAYDQTVAFLALAGPRDIRVIEHVRTGLTNDYVEVRLVAARAVGILGRDDGYTVAARELESKDARQRHLAALALGEIGRSDAQPLLAPLLDDKDAAVRTAAAKAILQLGKAVSQ